MGGITVRIEDAGTVWPLLLTAGGLAAMERCSETIELRDLVKAIYLVDLEHVLDCWEDWHLYEKLVKSAQIGAETPYLNRILYMISLDAVLKGAASFTTLGRPSAALIEVLNDAREVAMKRSGSAESPSSKDLLFCICSHDPDISKMLHDSGLQFEKLKRAVLG